MKALSSANNFANYRTAVHSISPPGIPFQGVILKDLAFIEESQSFLEDTGWVNFDKMVTLGRGKQVFRPHFSS